ncbi:hypothetical protein BLOT_011352 [Blomia tropicalis]|nr:hypothetical protein BLOT_011352 [Blomia tropicalis]
MILDREMSIFAFDSFYFALDGSSLLVPIWWQTGGYQQSMLLLLFGLSYQLTVLSHLLFCFH